MLKTQNGWTVEKMIAQVRAKNNGTRSIKTTLDDQGNIHSIQCRYRQFDDNGNVINCCAAGCFIPDDEYSTAMEGCSIAKVMECFPKLKFPLGVDEMIDFQRAHDFYDFYEGKEDMRDILEGWIRANVQDS